MSLDLRARAATARLALFAFNPNQRRGPDGRFIKMGDHELKRPRRKKPASTKEAKPTPNPAPKKPRGKKPAPARAATQPPLDAPYGERQAALARSVDSGVVGQKSLAQGQMGETLRREFADGTSVVYKRALYDSGAWQEKPAWSKKDQVDADELSSAVASALDVNAPAIHRVSDDEIYMELMPGEIGIAKLRAGVPFDQIGKPRQRRKIGLFDVLIDNPDRGAIDEEADLEHGEGNYLVDEDNNLYAIDHGLAFSNTYQIDKSGQLELTSVDRSAAFSPFAGEYVSQGSFESNNPMTLSDVAEVRKRLGRTREEFKRLDRLDWYDAMLGRLNLLAENAGGTIPMY